MTNKTITLSRELAEQIHRELTSGAVSIGTGAKLRAALADPVSPAGGGPEVLPQQKPRLAGYWFDLDLNDKIDDTFAKGWNAAGDAWQPHVTRLQAEVGDIRAQLGRQIERSNDFASKWSGADAERLALQSELTKARELLTEVQPCISAYTNGKKSQLRAKIDAFLSSQSAPADKGQGEPMHMCQKCYGSGSMPTRHAGEGETEYRNRCKLYAEQPAPTAFPGYPLVPEDRKLPAQRPEPVAVVPDFKMIGAEPMPPMEYDEP